MKRLLKKQDSPKMLHSRKHTSRYEFPHITLEDIIRSKQYYQDEDNWRALLRKLYCRLSLLITNTNDEAVTVNVLGPPQPASESITYGNFQEAATQPAGIPVSGNLNSGFTDGITGQVWAIAYNSGTRSAIYVMDDTDLGTILDTLEIADTSVKPVGIMQRAGSIHVLCNDDDTRPGVIIYNATTRALTGTYAVADPGDTCANILYNATNGLTYIGNITQGMISYFTGSTPNGTISVSPWAFALHPTLQQLYCITDPDNDGSIEVVDCGTNTVTDTISLPGTFKTMGGIVYNPGDDLMYVSGMDASGNISIFSIDASNNLSQLATGVSQTPGNIDALILAANPHTDGIIISLVTVGGSSTLLFLTTSGTLDYSVSTSHFTGVLFVSANDNLYASSVEDINVYQAAEAAANTTLPPGVTIETSTIGLSYEAVLYDIYFNPMLVRHTHVMYYSTAQMNNDFQLIWRDSSGHQWSDIYPMRLWQSASQPDQKVQEVFTFNNVCFDGRQSLNITINANDKLFIEFYYIKAGLDELMRKRLLGDRYLLPDERHPKMWQSSLLRGVPIAQMNEFTGKLI